MPTKNIINTRKFSFESILQWYKKHGRHSLPWRQVYQFSDKERLYHVWIAEVMLQQTQVDRVIWYYTRFLEKYPTIESLAETTYEELFPYWQGLGYYSRARRMIELARLVVEKYSGIFPNDFEKLRKLPWVGTYTSQALLAFGYNQTILALDANLQKIFSRCYFWTKFKKIQNDCGEVIFQLQKQVEKENISGRDINNALMDFWAYTGNLSPENLKDYPLKDCLWFQTKWTLEIKPFKLKHWRTQVLTHKTYACLIFLHENHKKYWSSIRSHYEPFLIEPTEKDDRKSIQDYFSTTYELEVSVRPSFWVAQYGNLDAKLFHAQIQTGNTVLTEFSKEKKEDWLKRHLFIS